jgi:hypothetical protein
MSGRRCEVAVAREAAPPDSRFQPIRPNSPTVGKEIGQDPAANWRICQPRIALEDYRIILQDLDGSVDRQSELPDEF